MNWTQEQKRAIERSGRILVSASAGSGKTTVMIERILRLVKEGADLREMMAVTFTRASASDMKAKLYEGLLKLGEDCGERIKTQIEILPECDVSTLHSWCQKMIKTHFYAEGIDPNFEIAEEGEADALLSEAVADSIESKLSGDDGAFSDFYDAFNCNRNDRILTEKVKAAYRFVSALVDGESWINGAMRFYGDDGEIYRELKAGLDVQKKVLSDKVKFLIIDTECAGYVRNLAAVQELVFYLDGRIESPISPSGKVGDFPELNERYKALKNEITLYLEDAQETENCTDYSKEYAQRFIELIKDTVKNYSAAKARLGLMDYADLEHAAFKILKNPEAQEQISKKYKYVFVDEYQDINPLQEAIVSLLDGEIFTVGDVKQSIYAFRNCQPQIFVDKYERYKELKQAVDLNQNFRSGTAILEFVNRVFSDTMTEDFGKVNYKRDAAFVPIGEEKGEVVFTRVCGGALPLAADKIYSVKNHDYCDEEDSLEEAECNEVIKCVLSLLEGGADMGDIVILVRSAGGFTRRLAAKLKECGIEVWCNGETEVSDLPEIRAVLDYLSLIDNRYDDVRLVSVMLNFFGFSEDELTAIRLSGEEKKTFYECAYEYPLQDGIKTKLESLLLKLERYAQLSLTVKADELAGLVVSEARYFEYLYSRPRGETEAVNLSEFLIAAARSPYNRSLSEYLGAQQRCASKLTPAGSASAVKIMTVHSSKGLEFPYVIVPNLDKRYNLTDISDNMIFDAQLGLCMKYWDQCDYSVKPTRLWKLASMRLKRRVTEEEMRVLYVALTRAKRGLYLFAKSAREEYKEKQSPENCFSYYDLMRRGVQNLIRTVSAADTHIEKPVGGRKIKSKPDKSLSGKIRERIEYKYPYCHNIIKTNVTYLAVNRDEEKIYYTSGGDSGDQALDRGNAYHKFMELADFEKDFDAEYSRLSFIEGFALILRDEIRAAFFKMRETLRGGKLYREQPFVMDIPHTVTNTEGEGSTLVQGVIDAFILFDDRAVIIDYKTTKKENILSEAYRFQLKIYKYAVTKLLGIAVADTYVYSFELQDLIKFETEG